MSRPAPEPIEVMGGSRPICDCYCPSEGFSRRCRKTAVASHDGVWLCPDCIKHNEVVRYAPVGRKIIWTK